MGVGVVDLADGDRLVQHLAVDDKDGFPTPLGPALGDREVEAAARPAVDLDVLALAEFGALHVGDRTVDRTVEYLIGVVVTA